MFVLWTSCLGDDTTSSRCREINASFVTTLLNILVPGVRWCSVNYLKHMLRLSLIGGFINYQVICNLFSIHFLLFLYNTRLLFLYSFLKYLYYTAESCRPKVFFIKCFRNLCFNIYSLIFTKVYFKRF